MKMQGGHTVSFSWKEGKVTELSVTLGYEKSAKFDVNGEIVTVCGNAGEEKKLI